MKRALLSLPYTIDGHECAVDENRSRFTIFDIFINPISKFLIEIIKVRICLFTVEQFGIQIIRILHLSKDFFSNPRFGGYFNPLFGKLLFRNMCLTNRIDLVIQKIKLAISHELSPNHITSHQLLQQIELIAISTCWVSGQRWRSVN